MNELISWLKQLFSDICSVLSSLVDLLSLWYSTLDLSSRLLTSLAAIAIVVYAVVVVARRVISRVKQWRGRPKW
jgi:hypothetical protein